MKNKIAKVVVSRRIEYRIYLILFTDLCKNKKPVQISEKISDNDQLSSVVEL